MIEFFAPSMIYKATKDLILFGRSFQKRKFSPEEKLALRDKWKPLFEEKLLDNYEDGIRRDVIIQDVRRMEKYPETDSNQKGISSWFRLGLIDTYHRGILVALGWDRLIEVSENVYRTKRPDEYAGGNESGIKVIRAGKIPYYLIESVEFDGDEYYGFPHIYCHFLLKGEPYESVQFYEEKQLDSLCKPFYVKIGDYAEIGKEGV